MEQRRSVFSLYLVVYVIEFALHRRY